MQQMHDHFETLGMTVFERGWLSSNNVLFCGKESQEVTLVDSGYCSHAEQTCELVRRAIGDRTLHRIVNTHLHSDHCGGNHALQQRHRCRIDVPSGEFDKVRRWDESQLTFGDTGQRCPRFDPTGVIRGGTEILLGDHRWRVISAPGHDPESIVLYQPDLELLISADALWENGFGVVFPELEGQHAFEDVQATLEILSALRVRWVIPGHGKPFSGLEAAVERAHARLEAFIRDPARHARHAAKVLMKFHLLEIGQATREDFNSWFKSTPFMRLIQSTYFEATAPDIFFRDLIRELTSVGALRLEGELISN